MIRLLTVLLLLLSMENISASEIMFKCYTLSISDGLLCNTVNDIVQDRDGYMWIGTSNGLCRYDGYSFINYSNFDTTPYKRKDIRVKSLLYDKRNNLLWICNSSYIYSCFDIGKSQFVNYASHADDNKSYKYGILYKNRLILSDPKDGYRVIQYQNKRFSVKDNRVYRQLPALIQHQLFLNKSEKDKLSRRGISNARMVCRMGSVTFVTDDKNGLWMTNKDYRAIHIINKLNTEYIRQRTGKYQIKTSNNGIYYIATYGDGLYVYNRHSNTMKHYSARDKRALFHSDYIHSIYIDSGKGIWVCAESAGLTYISKIKGAKAQYYYPEPDSHSEWANSLRRIFRLPDGTILLSNKENTLFKLNNRDHTISTFGRYPAMVYAYMIDNDGKKWIGTRGDGIYLDNQHYCQQSHHNYLHSNNIFDILQDRLQRIWIATADKGLLMGQKDGKGHYKFKTYLNRNVKESMIHDLEIDKQSDILYVATNNGLYSLDLSSKDIRSNSFIAYNMSNHSIPGDELICLKLASTRTLWIGTLGYGMIEYQLGLNGKLTKESRFDTSKGLASNNVRSIEEDRDGSIWVGTEEGISKIERKSSSIQTYNFSDNLMGNVYAENCSIKLPDGSIAMGTHNGLVMITPENKDFYLTPVDVCLTDIMIDGISIYNQSSSEYTDIREGLINRKEIDLPYYQNTIKFHFSDFQYSSDKSSLYQYYLEGIDKDWMPLTSTNYIEYRKLSPGYYKLHFRLFHNGKYNAEQIVSLRIHHPWYNTWWAWILYIIMSTTIIYHYIRFKNRNAKLHRQMLTEREQTEFRMNLFTNISHEFRTPLSIIQSAVDRLSSPEGLQNPKSTLQMAGRGVRRLLKMINMLMDFRRINTGNIILKPVNQDIIAFVRGLVTDFWSLSQQKDITISFTPFTNKYVTLFDPNLIETILYNIINNAIKYSPEKSNIDLRVSKEEENLLISCSDNGPGVSKDRQRLLFTPFMHGNVSSGGMGIGLYVAHSLALIHKGKLTYNDNNFATGSCFTLSIPITPSVYPVNASSEIPAKLSDKTSVPLEDMIKEIGDQSMNDETVIVIEDDPDLNDQLHKDIGKYFKVKCYTSGKEALDSILKDKPSLVLSDIILPDIDGYEITRCLRKDDECKNIPIILLSALDTEENTLKGFSVGAEDYIVKPYNPNVLIRKIIKFINLTNTCNNDNVIKESIVTHDKDKKFKEKLNLIIYQNLSDADLNIDKLADIMHIGKTKLNYKIHQLYGISPKKYIHNIRMEKAAELLSSGDYCIKEVCNMSGFNSVAYFTKCFREYYHETPSKYKD